MLPPVTTELFAKTGLRALHATIAEPERFACEAKVDGVRGLVVHGPERSIETRNRRGIRRDWLEGDGFEGGLRRLADRLPPLARNGFRRRTNRRPLLPDDGRPVRREGLSSAYRGGSRVGWRNVKDRSWYEREAWRFDR